MSLPPVPPCSKKTHKDSYSNVGCFLFSQQGPSIKYVTLFLANFYPPPPHCHTSWNHPDLLVGLVQKSGQKPPVQILSQLFAGFLSGRAVCQMVFGLEGFVRGGFCPFLLLSQYICYNRKLNITLNFMFNYV